VGNKSFSAADGVILASAKIVDEARVDLKAQIKTLEDKMGQVAAHWKGQGAQSFAAVQGAWSTNAQDVIDVLNVFEQNLRKNQATYSANDSGAVDLLSKYTTQLGK